MKWFLVVVSLASTHPSGDKDMWVVANVFNTERECVISGAESNLGLLARAHKEFDYYTKFPGKQPWDMWKAYCVDQKQFQNLMKIPKKERIT